MLKFLFGRLALLAITFATFSQAATIYLGYVTYQKVGSLQTTGHPSSFLVFNYTGGMLGGEVATPVTFKTASLQVTWSGAPGPVLTIDDPLTPNSMGYATNHFSESYGVTQAVFTALLTPLSPWTLNNLSVVTPGTNQFQMILNPANGTNFVAGEELWDILVETAEEVPEPATLLFAGIGLASLLFLRRPRLG